MFVFSHDQFKKLTNITDAWKQECLLDLGAGDGKVTAIIANHFDNIFVTEQSPTMRTRLTEMGYRWVMCSTLDMFTYKETLHPFMLILST